MRCCISGICCSQQKLRSRCLVLQASSHVHSIYVRVCSVCVLVCEVLSDTPCSFLSGCVSTLIAFSFTPLQPSLLHLFFSSVSALPLTSSGWLRLLGNFGQSVLLFSGIKLIHRSSDFLQKWVIITHYETKLASSCLLV